MKNIHMIDCEYYEWFRDFLRKHRPREDLPEPIADEKDVDDEEEKGGVKDGAVDRKSSSEDYLEPRRVMYQNVEAKTTITVGGEAPIKNLTLKDLVRFATEVARGMEFLASQKVDDFLKYAFIQL